MIAKRTLIVLYPNCKGVYQVIENERNECTKPNQHIPKYKHNHIGGNIKEKCTLSHQIK